jgi:amidophosphoribosyltransferase
VKQVYKDVKGAYSVVATLADVGMIAFRDPYGIKPIVFGEKETAEGHWFACASESVVLDVNGYKKSFDLDAGEAVFIPLDRKLIRRKLSDKPHRPCIFELVYFSRPDSFLDDISVYKTRARFGEALAKQWREANAPVPDAVIPIPDSSRDAALSMAMALGIPYREGLVKNRYIGRTFIAPSQKMRALGVRMKLNPLKENIAGKRLVVVDDSVVRGTTQKQLVGMLREAGATEVHLRLSSPPIKWSCFYGIDTGTRAELLAHNMTIDEIREYLNVDTLAYITLDRLVSATGTPDKAGFCDACFTGNYPVPIPVELRKNVLEKDTSDPLGEPLDYPSTLLESIQGEAALAADDTLSGA